MKLLAFTILLAFIVSNGMRNLKSCFQFIVVLIHSTVSAKIDYIAAEANLRVIIADWFTTAINSGDLSIIKKNYIKQLKSIKLSNALTDNLFASLQSLLPIMIANPPNASLPLLKNYGTEYADYGVDFVNSQPGLQGAATNQVLRRDPRNAEFYAFYDLLDSIGASLRNLDKNPVPASSYFNQEGAAGQARFIVIMAQLVNRLKAQ